VERYGDSLGGAFSSEASVAAAYNRGFRGLGENAGLTLPELQELRAEQSSVTMRYIPELSPVLSQPGTDAFRNWFGDSKVVDENGEPLVVYHGTDRSFTEFSAEAERLPWNADGVGHYFTSNPDRAAGYGLTVMPVYLRARNPKVSEGFEHTNVTAEQVAEMKAQGYDSMYFDGRFTNNQGREVQGPDEWIVFDPEQVKSAIGNRGTFDPADPNILNQSARGRILIDRANQKFNIELLEKADLSSFLHETGHYFLEVMGGIATDPAASERTKQMYADALAWMQVDGPEQIGTEQHELFARTFETIVTGKRA